MGTGPASLAVCRDSCCRGPAWPRGGPAAGGVAPASRASGAKCERSLSCVGALRAGLGSRPGDAPVAQDRAKHRFLSTSLRPGQEAGV